MPHTHKRLPFPDPASDAWFVPLPSGVRAKIDAEDAEWVGKHLWYLDNKKYAHRKAPRSQGQRNIYLHREIVARRGIDLSGLQVDHANGDTLDNRSSNLRACTSQQNCRNLKLFTNNKLGARGVCRFRNKYRAQIGVSGEIIYLGIFENLDDAIAARAAAEIQHFGEFRRKDA